MAERLLQVRLDELYPAQFVVESAGTAALAGNAIDAQVAGFIRHLGGSADNFSARQLTPEILRGKDLVLTLTRQHRGRVVEMAPSALRKTFTLREFARLLPQVTLDESIHGTERWRTAIPKALRTRSAPAGRPEDDDVVDPYKQDDRVYGLMRHQIESALLQIEKLSGDDTPK